MPVGISFRGNPPDRGIIDQKVQKRKSPFLHKFSDFHDRLGEDHDNDRCFRWFHRCLLPAACGKSLRSCSNSDRQVTSPTNDRDEIRDQVKGTQDVKRGRNENDRYE